MKKINEQWTDIKDYEGLYQVSNKGNIRSLKQWNGHCFINNTRALKLSYGTNDYWYIGLHKNGKMKRFCVHRLVAEAFIPNPNNLPIIMHKDDNPKNNNVDNLQWATQKENCNTPHHIQELSKSMSGKCGELNNFYGKKHTKRTKKKIRKNRLGKYNLGNHPNAKKVVCENKIFSCLKSCAEWYNINYSTMHSWINNINPMPNKFIQKGLKWLDE